MIKQQQFYLKDKPVCLELMRSQDLDFYLAVYQSGNVVDLLPKTYTADDLTRTFEKSINRNQVDKPVNKVFVVSESSTGQKVGLAAFKVIDDCGETGLIIQQQHSHRGYGKAVKKLLLKLAFETFSLRELRAECAEDNHRIQAINKKLGYICECSSDRSNGESAVLQTWVLTQQDYQNMGIS